jgi:hypothetical protein
MAAKPNPDMDERIAIPLDPELAIRALLRVDPDAEPAEDAQPEPPRKQND